MQLVQDAPKSKMGDGIMLPPDVLKMVIAFLGVGSSCSRAFMSICRSMFDLEMKDLLGQLMLIGRATRWCRASVAQLVLEYEIELGMFFISRHGSEAEHKVVDGMEVEGGDGMARDAEDREKKVLRLFDIKKRGWRMDMSVCHDLSVEGNWEVLRVLRRGGAVWDVGATYAWVAALGGPRTTTGERSASSMLSQQLLDDVRREVGGRGGTGADDRATEAASRVGDVDVLAWLRGYAISREGRVVPLPEWNPVTWGQTCARAAGGGHVECLAWARGYIKQRDGKYMQYARRVDDEVAPWYDTTLYDAASAGHLECIAWASGYVRRSTCSAGAGSFEFARDPALRALPLGQSLCERAAASGQLHCVAWARGYMADASGNFVRDTRLPQCAWNNTCELAAFHGHLGVLAWARGYTTDPRGRFVVRLPLRHACYDVAPWGFACESAAEGGHLHVLAWLAGFVRLPSGKYEALCGRTNIGPEWDAWTWRKAAAKGHLEVLAWGSGYVRSTEGDMPFKRDEALRRDMPVADVVSYAALSGKLDVLAWIRGYMRTRAGALVRVPELPQLAWGVQVCFYAACSGSVDVLAWARGYTHHAEGRYVRDPALEQAPWGRACDGAASRGHLRLLAWARGYVANTQGMYVKHHWGGQHDGWHDAPWGPRTCAEAAAEGHLHILAWARGFVQSAHSTPTPTPTATPTPRTGGSFVRRVCVEEEGGEKCVGEVCDWDTTTCAAAASGGHLRVLAWARGFEMNEGGEWVRVRANEDDIAPWDSKTCENAAWEGHLDVLAWARGYVRTAHGGFRRAPQLDCAPWDAGLVMSLLPANVAEHVTMFIH